MKRRTYLASVGASVTGLGGCTVIGAPRNGTQEDYQGEQEVVYEHDDLKLRLRQEKVQIGDTIAFEVTNTTDSRIGLGCHNPWALQQQTPNGWRHVTWTNNRYYQACLTLLGPGDTLVEEIKLSKAGLESQVDTVNTKLRSGTYRFLLLGSSPYLATEFTVRE